MSRSRWKLFLGSPTYKTLTQTSRPNYHQQIQPVSEHIRQAYLWFKPWDVALREVFLVAQWVWGNNGMHCGWSYCLLLNCCGWTAQYVWVNCSIGVGEYLIALCLETFLVAQLVWVNTGKHCTCRCYLLLSGYGRILSLEMFLVAHCELVNSYCLSLH